MSENGPHILVVDDHRDIRESLARYLRKNGLRSSVADSAAQARKFLKAAAVDLIVLDIMMPGEDGLSLCRSLVESGTVPVILLTAMAEDTDRIVGLEIGADDYVTKPWDERELLARIRSVMRRVTERRSAGAKAIDAEQRQVSFNGWILNLDSRELKNPEGRKIELTSGEFSLLNEFIEKAGRVLSRDHLLRAIYSRDWEPFDRSIDVLVTRLRRKIEADSRHPEIIKTVRGTGYMFAAAIKRAD